MSELREPSDPSGDGSRARLIAGSIVLLLVVALVVAFVLKATRSPKTTGIHQSVTRGNVTVSLEIDGDGTTTVGSTVTGQVTLVNNSGHDIGVGGPGSCAKDAFVVNLEDEHGDQTDEQLDTTCSDNYKFPSGTTTDSLKLDAKDGSGHDLPPGSYHAVLTVSAAYPVPVPAPVSVTIRS